MPTKSAEQARLMQAVAHNKAFAKKVDIPQNVGHEFVAADAAKGKHMATKPTRKMPSFLGKTPAGKGKNLFAGKESKAEEAMEKKQFPGKKAYAKAEAKFEQERPGMKGGGKVKKYAAGGEIEEGPNKNIDDETRARAMRFARGEMEPDATAVSAPRRVARPPATPRPSTPRPSTPVAAKPMAKYSPEAPNTFDPEIVGSGPRALPQKPTAGAGRGGQGGPTASELKRQEFSDMLREAGTYRGEGKPGAPTFIPGMSGVGRAAASAVRGMGAPTTKAVAEIGKRVAKTPDEMMAARGAETAKKATSEARSAAAKSAERVMTGAKKPKASPRARTRGNPEESGVEFQRGGAVRGGGAAKRGVGRGKMC